MRNSSCSIGGRAAAVRLGVALLLSLLLPAVSGRAQAPAAADNQPVQIHADSGIEWDQSAHVYIARGEAVAIRGPSTVHADVLVAHYRDVKNGGNAGGKTEIYRLDADGHVVLTRNADTVTGDRAVDDIDQAVAVVTGHDLKLTTPTDTVTARDSLEWYDSKEIAVASGDAVAVHNDRTVKGDILTAYFHKTPTSAKPGAAASRSRPAATSVAAKGVPEPGAAKISRIDAQGHVVVSNGIDTGRGDFGVYNADTGIATLIGNVVIERGKDVITGQRGVMDLNRNIARMLPGRALGRRRVEGLFVREQQRAGAPPTAGAKSTTTHRGIR